MRVIQPPLSQQRGPRQLTPMKLHALDIVARKGGIAKHGTRHQQFVFDKPIERKCFDRIARTRL
jgi:hypothetical protein